MPAVFVHGVPDTERVWRAVVSRVARTDVVTLSLPGFGCGTPDGFAATKEAYVDWLLATLAGLPAPIDVVGHDWGALLVVRAVSLRPDLVRTWAAGGAPLDPEYVWHQAAQTWQTPDVGERVMEKMTPDGLRRALVAAGVPEADAAEASSHVDAPGLVLWGEKDPYAEARFGRRLAELTGARFVQLPCSHWWQLERPDEVARELAGFWNMGGSGRPPSPPNRSGPPGGAVVPLENGQNMAMG